MARTRELLDSLGIGDDGVSPLYPENFNNDIGAAFDEDMAGADAKIGVLTNDLAAANEQILALKAHNYELMTASASAPDMVVGGDENTDPDEPVESEDDEEPSGMDRIFAKKKDDE